MIKEAIGTFMGIPIYLDTDDPAMVKRCIEYFRQEIEAKRKLEDENIELKMQSWGLKEKK